MNKRDTVFALIALGAAPFARAQQMDKIYRVAWVNSTVSVAEITKPTYPLSRALLGELRKLGYVEGKNLLLDVVSAEGHQDRYAALVSEILRRKPDVILVSGSQMAVVAKKATSTVPIVMSATAQPVRYG